MKPKVPRRSRPGARKCGKWSRSPCAGRPRPGQLAKHEDGRGQRSPRIGYFGLPRSAEPPATSRDVNSAMATVVEKKSCARVACGTKSTTAADSSTVNPPSTPCTITASERDHRQPASTGAIHAKKPDQRNDREKPHGCRDHAVAVLIEDSAFHWRHQFAVRERPVRHRKAGIAAGHQAARDHQQQRAEGQQNRPAVQTGVCIGF